MAATPKCLTDDEDDDKKVYPTNKVSFVDSHGVKSLPYQGRRTNFSSIRQILGSSTERHNDLFGLAIFQFEREYKASFLELHMIAYFGIFRLSLKYVFFN
jgi:hypothetical protein